MESLLVSAEEQPKIGPLWCSLGVVAGTRSAAKGRVAEHAARPCRGGDGCCGRMHKSTIHDCKIAGT